MLRSFFQAPVHCFRANLLRFSTAASATASKSAVSKPVVVEAGTRNLKQSPLKIKFLVSLIQGKWLPDALAQLKFSPKHRAVDVAKIVRRAAALARIFHSLVPEELIIKEVLVTKGMATKRMRIMGRGRTGFGYIRQAHVLVKVSPVDFASKIRSSRDVHERAMWRKRELLAIKVKEDNKLKTTATAKTSAA